MMYFGRLKQERYFRSHFMRLIEQYIRIRSKGVQKKKYYRKWNQMVIKRESSTSLRWL